MHFGRISPLRGPNIWAAVPVIVADLAPGGREADVSVVAGPLRAALGDAVPPLPERATLADAVLAATRGFQKRADFAGAIGFVRPAESPGEFRLVFDYDDENVALACLRAGRALVAAAAAGEPFDAPAKLAEVRAVALDSRLGPSTAGIAAAAVRRGIPVRRLNDGSLVQLGWGAKQKRIWTAESDDTPAVAEAIAQDKQLTRNLFAGIGVPAPWGRPVRDPDDAWAVAVRCESPVVVKPRFGNQGRGVATNLTTREQVVAAYHAALAEGAGVVVETFAPGRDYRLLVVGGKVVAASIREPAHVVGDGKSTVRELVEIVNRDPRRSDGHSTPLSWIKIDAVAEAVLAEQGFAPDAVPPAGVRVLIRRNANLSTGGTATDVTDRVHPEVAADAVAAAKAVGLDIAGVDIVCEDISRPLGPQRGVVVEANAGPGLRMHLEPSAGEPRDVGAAIVDALFPNGETGRVPIVAVAGDHGTAAAKWVARLVAATGKFVGSATAAGIELGGRLTPAPDGAGPASARQVLLNSRVEVAVLEADRDGILREGLGFDRCDVAVLTTAGDAERVVAGAVSRTGTAILPATAAGLAEGVRGRVLLFTADESDPALVAHRGSGGLAAFVRGSEIILADGPQETPIAAPGGEAVLPAAAAAWRLGVPAEVIAAAIQGT